MPTTVNWLLTQESMEGFFLLAGDTSLHVPITGINIMDNPDTVPWLAEGTLVLSTGYLFMDPDFTTDIIRRMAGRGCSGLGIKMNRYINELPESMIHQAKELHFPIFSIPFSSSMDQIANLIYRRLYEEEMSEAQRLALLYKDISECVFKKQSLSRLLPLIGNALNASVFLTNDSFEIMEFFHTQQPPLRFPFPFSKDTGTLFPETDILYLKNHYNSTHLPYIAHSVTFEGNAYEFEIFPVQNKNTLLGFLVLLKETDTADAYDFISNLQNVLCIAMMNHSVLTETERSNRDIFFQKLLSGQYSFEQEIEPLCLQNHFDFQKERICALFSIPEYEGLTIAKRRPYERKVFSALQEVCQNCAVTEIHTVFQTGFVLFLLSDQRMLPAEASAIGLEIVRKCLSALSNAGITAAAGISRNANGALTIYPGYCQARMALDLGPRLHSKENCYSYFQDQIYHNFISHFTHQELQEIYDEYLGRLEKYDIQNQAELLPTLEAYLKFSGNITQTAKALFIHRNTMFYRLDQIKNILHINLDDTAALYQLQTGLYIRKIL